MSNESAVKLNYQLFGDRVLLEQEAQAVETKSGILLAAKQSQENVLKGTILLTGPDVQNLSVGDDVMYGSFSGVPLRLSEGDYLLVHQDDILVKVGGN